MPTRPKRRRPRSGAAQGLSLADYRLLAEFRSLLTRFLDFSARGAHGEGLAPRRHQALAALSAVHREGLLRIAPLLGPLLRQLESPAPRP